MHILSIAMMGMTVALLPVFLTGALGVHLSAELAFGATGLGLAVSAFRLGATVSSKPMGNLTDRLGANKSLRLGGAIAGVCSLAIAVAARSWTILVVMLFVAGAGQALAQPATNRLLLLRIAPNRQGLAFGAKQAATPVASMIAGLSVPVVAMTLGWRAAYAMVSVIAIVVVAWLGRGRSGPRAQRVVSKVKAGAQPRWGTLTIVLLAFGFANASSNAIPAFYVSSAVDAGSSGEIAGTVLAAGSAVAIVTRIGTGILSDRLVSGHFLLCAAMLAVGSVGLVMLGVGGPVAKAAGLAIALGGTWGFNGVFWFALMRSYPRAPGAVTGSVAPGGAVGSTIGPALFGVLVDGSGYLAAWIVSAALAALAAVAMVLVSRMIGNERPGGEAVST